MPTRTRDAEKISVLNPMLASSSTTMSPFLQLRIALRPRNTPLPIRMPSLSVPFASRQQPSSMTTLSAMWILCGWRSTTPAPKATPRPHEPSSQGYSFERRNSPSAPGSPQQMSVISFVLEQRQEAGLADDQFGVPLRLRLLLVEQLALDHGDPRVVLARWLHPRDSSRGPAPMFTATCVGSGCSAVASTMSRMA